MANAAFTLNGYSYADGKAVFNGLELPGVTAFEFKKTKSKTNNYGLGANPVSRGRGANEYSGSLEMDYDTQKILSTLSPDGTLTEIPPGVMVFTLERVDGGKEIITMGFFEFQGDGISGTVGDENLTDSNDVIFGSFIKESF